ncbi:MAG: hypothetical protein D6784_04415 [Chloroflexi bacterium]|nr:MAG: hypothetical protein D6784_04415 [Chloroflexota bacterium]
MSQIPTPDELNRLTGLPAWGRKQENRWDALSRFVYRTATLEDVRRQAQTTAAEHRLDAPAFEAYAVRRWFNFHTHNRILQMFLSHPDVEPEQNRRHHSIDFYLRGIPFDLKISEFPRGYPQSLAYARQNPHHLAVWQYRNQSRQGRYHTGNRLFVVLHHTIRPELTWQLRRDFDRLQMVIADFLATPTLLGLTIVDQQSGEVYRPWAGVIFCVK